MTKIKCFYLVEFDNGIKFGISDNFYERLHAYKSPWCKKIMSVHYLPHNKPNLLETHFKKKFKKSIKSDFSFEFVTNISIIELLNELSTFAIDFGMQIKKMNIGINTYDIPKLTIQDEMDELFIKYGVK